MTILTYILASAAIVIALGIILAIACMRSSQITQREEANDQVE